MTNKGEGEIAALKRGVDYINPGDDDQCEIYGYCRSKFTTIITWFFIICTGGLLRLVFHWVPQFMLLTTHTRCLLKNSTKVLVVEQYKKYKRIYVKDVKTMAADQVRYESDYSVLHGGGVVLDPPKTYKNGSPGSPPAEQIDLEQNDKMEKENSQYLTIPSPSSSTGYKEVKSIRWFNCKKVSYLWDSESESFYKLNGYDEESSLDLLHSKKGMSWQEQARMRLVYGENNIKVPITPILKLLFLEALNPFYIFQVFSVILWFIDDYIYYATVIVVTSVGSIISEVYQMHQNEKSLSKTIQSSDVVKVVRENGEVEEVPSEHLVPGDVVSIPPQGCMMQCDAVLLKGSAIVNESMLTGESVPVTKTDMVNEAGVMFKEKEHNRHVLYCGTQVIQTRFYGGEHVLAVVIRTGFMTSKGSLVRSIMYPPPVDFKFLQDAYRFICFLVGIASFGFIYTIATKVQRDNSWGDIIVDSLDLITIVVPPALPMAMTVGVLYALSRLKHHKIYCISPRSINLSGVINCVCFDKTGTLTEDGLDMKGVVKVISKRHMGETFPFLDQMISGMKLPLDHLLYGMATCHSITIIDKKMVGDPLDLIMFENTGWEIEEPGQEDTNKYDMIMPTVVHPKVNDQRVTNSVTSDSDPCDISNRSHQVEVGILRQFQFSSSLQRMSVITRLLGETSFNLYCKGSPEMIASLSIPSSVPSNFRDILLSYTLQGYRVIGLGYKVLKLSYPKAQRINRVEVEKNLNFLGLLVMENRLKSETSPVIRELGTANIRMIMVTGDNMLTALSVGRECGIVNSDVITIKASAATRDQPSSVSFENANNFKPKPINHLKNGGESVCIDDPLYCFAIEGSSWAVIQRDFPQLLPKIAVRGSVFARMSPDQKQQLITELQALGYYVGMCGDGANDCGALKSAHAGISLSDTEASVASPFTSKRSNISCVPKLIREGRAALVTSFGVFKYMAAYSLTQFVSVMILYSIDSNLTDIQFLYIDLFLITLFAFFFGKTESYEGNLADRPPPSSLISVAPIASILLHIALVIVFQTFGFFYVRSQDWFVPFNSTQDETVGCYENYAVFSISQFQYIILAVVFSKGLPYRKPLYTNYILMGSILLMTAISIVLTLIPPQFLKDIFEIVTPPDTSSGWFFRGKIIFIAFVNCLMSVLIEYFLVEYVTSLGRFLNARFRASKTKKKYLAIEKELSEDSKWPQIVKVKADEANTTLRNNLKRANGNDLGELSLDPIKLVTYRTNNEHFSF